MSRAQQQGPAAAPWGVAVALVILFTLSLVDAAMGQEVAAEEEASAEEQEVLSEELFRELAGEAVPVEKEEAEEVEAEPEAGPPAPPPEELDPAAIQVGWDQGIRIERNDKRFRMKIGGRFMFDQAWIGGDSAIEDEFFTGSDEDVRRAWLDVTGVFRGRFIYKAQVDLAANSSGDDERNRYIRQTYVGWTIPGTLNGVRVGFVKEPFGMSAWGSNLNLVFMERPLATVFAPTYNLGILFNGQLLEQRMSWAAGAFRYSGDHGDRERLDLTGRVTAVLLAAKDERKLLHVGASYGHQFRNEFDVRYRRRPESNLADRYVDTGDIEADGVDLYGVELAGKWGSAAFQSELAGSYVNRSQGKSVDFWGAYFGASYFLTGEQRPYQRRGGVFGRVSPKNPFDWKARSWGGWEVAARFSYVDLDDREVRGGTMSTVTLGLNWYLFPHLRIMANYIRAHVNNLGDSDIFQLRFQIDY